MNRIVLLSAGIANENGGITFIPVQVSMTGQSGPGLQPLTAQALTGSLNTQQLTTTMPAGTAHTSPTTNKQAKMSHQQGTPNRAQRTGSLCLFFRKVSIRTSGWYKRIMAHNNTHWFK